MAPAIGINPHADTVNEKEGRVVMDTDKEKDPASKESGMITEIRDFAGQDVEVKKLVDTDSKEASDKTKASSSSAVDVVLKQIKKKHKLSVLDKTKNDRGDFKDENKGMEDELDAYKKDSNQYLDSLIFAASRLPREEP